VDRLTAAQERTEERLAALAEAQTRTEKRLDALIAVVEEIRRDTSSLLEWRRGEEGRRLGERYERETVRHAFAIFGGGGDVRSRPDDRERIEES
jgi:hypothetical protein